MTSPTEDGGAGRAQIVGTGLIGGSLGLALRRRGWHVSGDDADPVRAEAARAAGAVDDVGVDHDATVAFVATPAAQAAAVALRLLADTTEPALVVSDVSGVKGSVVAAVDHPRFVGGHPMAGSEQVGLEGADPGLFEGATWVLTPTARTDLDAFARLRAVVTSLGAEVLALDPTEHDRLVAVVSHVPHLVAATLMAGAARHAEEDKALLRLAAGGFRDMTRVAAGHPGIWPDVCADNRPAIVDALDDLLGDLAAVRLLVATGDGGGLLALLERASAARRELPARATRPEHLAEVRVLVRDRPGELAELTGVASRAGVNIYDIEIAHSAEGPHGVLVLVVAAAQAETLKAAAAEQGYAATVGELG